jgi:hypothetical protein
MLNRRQYGQSIVEFALIITVLFTMLLGMVDFGLIYNSQVVIRNAVAEAGYYAIQNPRDTAGIEAAIDLELANRPFIEEVGTPTINTCVGSAGDEKTTIEVTYIHHMLFSYLVPSMQVTLKSQTEVPQLGC